MDRSRRRAALVGALFVGACQQPGDPTTTDATTATSTDATTAGTLTPEPTTAGASIGAESGFGGECPDLPDPPDELNEAVVAECDALCVHYQECGLKEHELCRMGCVAKFGVDHEACYAAGSAARACLTTMTCEDLGLYLQFNAGGPCEELLADQYKACTCQVRSLINVTEDQCAYSLTCPYLPYRQIACHNGTCECNVEGELVKTCKQSAGCHDGLDIDAEAESCCCMVR